MQIVRIEGTKSYQVVRRIPAPEVNTHKPNTTRKCGFLRVVKHKMKMKYRTHSSERE